MIGLMVALSLSLGFLGAGICSQLDAIRDEIRLLRRKFPDPPEEN